MTDIHIDYEGLGSLDPSRGPASEPGAERHRGRSGLVRALLKAVVGLVVVVVVLVFPFVLMIGVGVRAYGAWGLSAWPALASGVLATAVLLSVMAWLTAWRLGGGARVRSVLVRAAALLAVGYAAWSLIYIASANVKSDEVRSEYRTLHPLLRLSASTLVLVDRSAVLTDASRSVEDYAAMGLPANEASLHFPQSDGFVHALDLRTLGRPEWRNRARSLYFRSLGFHTLRHVGTADHLHVSLRLPR